MFAHALVSVQKGSCTNSSSLIYRFYDFRNAFQTTVRCKWPVMCERLISVDFSIVKTISPDRISRYHAHDTFPYWHEIARIGCSASETTQKSKEKRCSFWVGLADNGFLSRARRNIPGLLTAFLKRRYSIVRDETTSHSLKLHLSVASQTRPTLTLG
jgi:hypothetical protein